MPLYRVVNTVLSLTWIILCTSHGGQVGTMELDCRTDIWWRTATHSYNLRLHTSLYFIVLEVRLKICVRRTSVMEAGKEEQRCEVRLLIAEGGEGRKIHRRLSAVYGEHRM